MTKIKNVEEVIQEELTKKLREVYPNVGFFLAWVSIPKNIIQALKEAGKEIVNVSRPINEAPEDGTIIEVMEALPSKVQWGISSYTGHGGWIRIDDGKEEAFPEYFRLPTGDV